MSIEALSSLVRSELVRPVDRQIAAMLSRRGGENDEQVILAAALTASAVGAGDVCLYLREAAGRRLSPEIRTPGLGEWEGRLRGSLLVSQDGSTPLVLDNAGRLYLQRHWLREQRVATALQARAARPLLEHHAGLLERLLDELMPRAAIDEQPDWQRVAVALAACKSLAVITGGPGTGKTTTLARLVAVLVSLSAVAGETLRIGIAAPTGKGAVRVQDALSTELAKLDLTPSARSMVPGTAQTIHRLLGSEDGVGRARYRRANPLPLDVLVLDEASMIDLGLMARLLEALREDARLVLLGDPDQLASVQAGSVLRDLCMAHAPPVLTEPLARRLRGIEPLALRPPESPGPPGAFGPVGARTEAPLTPVGESAEPGGSAGLDEGALSESRVVLRQRYRFAESAGVGALADAIREGSAERVVGLLDAERGLRWRVLEPSADALEQVLPAILGGYEGYLEALREGASASAVLERMNEFRVLAPFRRGALGTEPLNHAVDTAVRNALSALGSIAGAPEMESGTVGPRAWAGEAPAPFHGQPVMVVRNDYDTSLFNGDVGIIGWSGDGVAELRAQFRSVSGTVRELSLPRLPAYELAYALTVHKCQGSEFDRVLLVLPAHDTPLGGRSMLTRELLYTAVTRARRGVEIWATEESLTRIVEARLARRSGLHDALWGAAGEDRA